MLLFVVLDGTFMAALIGGYQWGVVKSALLNCIKISRVPDRSRQAKADTSSLISALDFAVRQIRTFPTSAPPNGTSQNVPVSVIVVPWVSPVNVNQALDLAVRILSNCLHRACSYIRLTGLQHHRYRLPCYRRCRKWRHKCRRRLACSCPQGNHRWCNDHH